MTEKYSTESLSKLFDDTKKSLKEEKSNFKEEINNLERNERNSMKVINTSRLASAIVMLLREVMIGIQITKEASGKIDVNYFNKYYYLGKLKEVKEELDEEDDFLSIFKDRRFVWNDEYNYETPNVYNMKDNELSMLLNFSSTSYLVRGENFNDGGYLEWDDIDEELLASILEEEGITLKIHKQFGLDTSRVEIINTIVLEVHYYRDKEKVNVKKKD